MFSIGNHLFVKKKKNYNNKTNDLLFFPVCMFFYNVEDSVFLHSTHLFNIGQSFTLHWYRGKNQKRQVRGELKKQDKSLLQIGEAKCAADNAFPQSLLSIITPVDGTVGPCGFLSVCKVFWTFLRDTMCTTGHLYQYVLKQKHNTQTLRTKCQRSSTLIVW